MKLAEALQERKDLNGRLEQLRQRLRNNALVQENEKTAEDPAELLRELEGAAARLKELMARINLTNCRAAAELDGETRTLTELIAEKDALTVKLAAYRELIDAASQTARAARGSEIRIRAAVPVAELQKQTDGMARRLRLLDNLLQETNWKTELV